MSSFQYKCSFWVICSYYQFVMEEDHLNIFGNFKMGGSALTLEKRSAIIALYQTGSFSNNEIADTLKCCVSSNKKSSESV